MKLILILSILLLCLNSKAQEVIIDSCGLDSSPYLNQHELLYFNRALPKYYLDVSDQDLALKGKRILFKSGGTYHSKKEFFEKYGGPWFEEENYPSVQLITLTDEEIEQLKEYDAIIVTWSKISVNDKKVRKSIIKDAIEKVHNSP